MKEHPLVSIIIPVFNREELIDECIVNALAQTYSNTEIIVIDNCSTDSTYNVMKKYLGNEKIVIQRNERNIGPVLNWQKGVQHAKGKYIKILFSDDLMQESFIERSVYELERNPMAAFVCSAVHFFSDISDEELDVKGNYSYKGYRKKLGPFIWHKGMKSYRFGKTGYYDKKSFYERCFGRKAYKGILVSPSAAVFRKDEFKIVTSREFGTDLPLDQTGAGVDVNIFLSALKKRGGFFYIDEVLVYFRSHEGSISVSSSYNLGTCYEFVRKRYITENFLSKYYCWEIAYEQIHTKKSIISDEINNLYGAQNMRLYLKCYIYFIFLKIAKRIFWNKPLNYARRIEVKF